jgi:activator of HSP90 ATPase
LSASDGTLNRRRVMSAIAATFGSIATLSSAAAIAQPTAAPVMTTTPPPTMNQAPAMQRSPTRSSIHQEVDFHNSPERVYGALITSKDFTAFSGMNAVIDRGVGGGLSLFGGMVVGRTVELIPNREIVQAWRSTSWDPGIYSIVRIQLLPNGTGTHLILDQTAFPEGEYERLDAGWPVRYWKPLTEYLGEVS